VDVVGKKMVLALVFVTLGAYLVTLVAKEVVSINTLAVTEVCFRVWVHGVRVFVPACLCARVRICCSICVSCPEAHSRLLLPPPSSPSPHLLTHF
jgi:hypothetical protein